MRRVYKNLCFTTISASIMAANMWKNSLKNAESDNNKILYETLFDFFLQRNGTYFLNKPHNWKQNHNISSVACFCPVVIDVLFIAGNRLFQHSCGEN